MYHGGSWPKSESKFSLCSGLISLKKPRALWFTKDRGEGTSQLTSFTNKASQVQPGESSIEGMDTGKQGKGKEEGRGKGVYVP